MAIIGSGIEDIESTIARTMGEIGWPGADQVQPEEDNAEPVTVEVADNDENLASAEDDADDSVGDQAGDETQAEDAAEAADTAKPEETAYRPKWKKSALAELDKLPPEVQSAFIAEDKRREENFHKGIEQYRTGHATSKEWDEVITPYRATIDHFKVKPQEAVRQLLATDHILRYGQPQQKVGTILQVLQGYGINPNDLMQVMQSSGEQQPADPQYQALNQRLSAYEQREAQRQQEVEQAYARQQREATTGIQTQIESFASDPDHEHFETLKPMMAGLLQSGAAKGLDDAYEMAFKAHPQTAQIWIAQQQKQMAETRKAAVEKAKKVTNVRSNGRASVSSPTAPATMEETIRRTAEKLGLA